MSRLLAKPGDRFTYEIKKMRQDGSVFTHQLAVKCKSAAINDYVFTSVETVVDPVTKVVVMEAGNTIHSTRLIAFEVCEKWRDISNEFSRLVHQYYTPAQIAAINIINQQPGNENTCATHDYFDANMIMDEAFTNAMGRGYIFYDDERPETELQHEDDTDLINRAWSFSKAKGFKI